MRIYTSIGICKVLQGTDISKEMVLLYRLSGRTRMSLGQLLLVHFAWECEEGQNDKDSREPERNAKFIINGRGKEKEGRTKGGR